jgi:hypothetical protein
MPLHTVQISDADADIAKYEMFLYPDLLVQKRMLCIWLKYLGCKHQDIADILECCRNKVGNYLSPYAASDIDRLRVVNY